MFILLAVSAWEIYDERLMQFIAPTGVILYQTLTDCRRENTQKLWQCRLEVFAEPRMIDQSSLKWSFSPYLHLNGVDIFTSCAR